MNGIQEVSGSSPPTSTRKKSLKTLIIQQFSGVFIFAVYLKNAEKMSKYLTVGYTVGHNINGQDFSCPFHFACGNKRLEDHKI